MRVRFDIALLFPFLLIFLLSLAGCGGGGGSASAAVSTPASESLFVGDYHFVGFGIANPGTVLATSQWGLFSADGDGALTGSATLNLNGGLSTGASATDLLYAVDPDYALRWQVATDPTVDTLVGGIATDGRAFTLGSVTDGSTPFLMIGAKKTGNYTPADLAGRYHVAALVSDASGPMQLSFWGSANFDGAGAVAFTAELNANGGRGAIPPNSGTYTVAADGEVTWSLGSSSDVLAGGMLGNGELVVLGGMSNSGGDPSLFVLIPTTTGASDSTFAGTYQFVGFEATSSTTFETRTGTLVADGTGAVEAQLTNNAGGVISTMSSGALTFSVSGDGTLTLSGDAELSGGVSPDGRFFVLAGGTAAGDTSTVVVGVR